MKSVTQIKSLGDMRTTVSTHARSAPRQNGSTYLEIYLLDKERQRLETELAMVTKRQRRIEGRLAEIQGAIDKLVHKPQQEQSSPSGPPASAAVESPKPEGRPSHPRKWRGMTIEY